MAKSSRSFSLALRRKKPRRKSRKEPFSASNAWLSASSSQAKWYCRSVWSVNTYCSTLQSAGTRANQGQMSISRSSQRPWLCRDTWKLLKNCRKGSTRRYLNTNTRGPSWRHLLIREFKYIWTTLRRDSRHKWRTWPRKMRYWWEIRSFWTGAWQCWRVRLKTIKVRSRSFSRRYWLKMRSWTGCWRKSVKAPWKHFMQMEVVVKGITTMKLPLVLIVRENLEELAKEASWTIRCKVKVVRVNFRDKTV